MQKTPELSQAGKPITDQAVCAQIGISSGIIRYPRVKEFVGQFVDYAQQQQRQAMKREQALLKEVSDGVKDLKENKQPVTYSAISKKIGIDSSIWLPYAQVRAFVDQHLDSQYLRIKQERDRREEVLISRVEEALCQLETASIAVTIKSVANSLGVSSQSLKIYPRVKALIEQRRSRPYTGGGQPKRSEEQVFSEVQRTIALLTERNASVTYAAIIREMGGISIQALSTNPKVRMLVDEHLQLHHLYQLQQFARREEQLLCQVKDAITKLETQGKPFTQRDLCEMVGMSRSGLRKYPRVKALLEQKVTRYHVYQRRRVQLEEEELTQRVKEAIIDLSDRKEHITPDKVARKMKISTEVLTHSPQVVVLLEQCGYKKRKPRAERVEELLDLVRVRYQHMQGQWSTYNIFEIKPHSGCTLRCTQSLSRGENIDENKQSLRTSNNVRNVVSWRERKN